MFVSQKRYNELYREAVILRELAELLTRQIKRLHSRRQAFDQDDIARLLRLCHPDKHGNSETANAMTQKLLTMRGGK